jgi:hypothetical protein
MVRGTEYKKQHFLEKLTMLTKKILEREKNKNRSKRVKFKVK